MLDNLRHSESKIDALQLRQHLTTLFSSQRANCTEFREIASCDQMFVTLRVLLQITDQINTDVFPGLIWGRNWLQSDSDDKVFFLKREDWYVITQDV